MINIINKKSEEEIFNNMINAKNNEIEINEAIPTYGKRSLNDDDAAYTYIFYIFKTKLKNLDENTLDNIKKNKIEQLENLINTQTAEIEKQKKISLDGTDFEDFESFRNEYNKMVELDDFIDINKKNDDVDVEMYNNKVKELIILKQKLKTISSPKNILKVEKLNKDISKLEELNQISTGLSNSNFTIDIFKKLKTEIDKSFKENKNNIPEFKTAFHLLYIEHILPLINDAIESLKKIDDEIDIKKNLNQV